MNGPACDETQYRLGLGVEGQVNGYYMHVGNERFMRQSGIRVDVAAVDRAALDERGVSCLHIAVDGKLAGLAPYADEIRLESRSVIKDLSALGIKNSIMLTGDNEVVARAVGRRLGLTRQFADMLPADKASVVRICDAPAMSSRWSATASTISPALSFADVGIAMRHGAKVAHESAHVVLMEDLYASSCRRWRYPAAR